MTRTMMLGRMTGLMTGTRMMITVKMMMDTTSLMNGTKMDGMTMAGVLMATNQVSSAEKKERGRERTIDDISAIAISFTHLYIQSYCTFLWLTIQGVANAFLSLKQLRNPP